MTTPQEEFWGGSFGDDYSQRNRVRWQDRIPFWSWILIKTGARSVLDVGTNAGWNLRALNEIDPRLCLWGCDVNDKALEEARAAGLCVSNLSIFDLLKINQPWYLGVDLVVTSGVLIHVAPEDLLRAMTKIALASQKWVLAVEYAADYEQEVPYRGHSGKLWRRPFGRIYQELGLELVEEIGTPVGFDRCHAWLMRRP